MQTEEFLKKVRVRAGLADNEQARLVTDAVFGALRARISHGGGDNVADQLPKEIRELWESGLMAHVVRSLVAVERMDLHEFLAKIQNTAHLADIGQAEVAARAVFTTLREQITPGAQHTIENQLPEDIRAVWQTSTPEETKEQPAGRYGPEEIGPSAVSLYRSDEQIMADIRETLESSDEVDADKIDVHVRQGVVTLRGVVGSSTEWEAAERIASGALGVQEVRNELAVVEAM